MSTPFDSLISNAAALYSLPSEVLHNLVQSESSFNPDAVGSSGEQGLTQMMPNTSASLGVDDPFDPSQSIYGGAAYLAQLTKRFGGDLTKGLEAYNAGPTAVENGTVPASSVSYAQNILSGTQPQASANTAQQTGSVLGMAVADAATDPTGSLAKTTQSVGSSFLSNLLNFSNPVNIVSAIVGVLFIFVGGLMFVFPGTITNAVKTVEKHPEILAGA